VKRFEFRLEQALKVKRQQERLAELEQQRARVRMDAAQAQVAALHRKIEELAVALDKDIRRAGGQQLWMAHYDQSRLLGLALTAAEQRVRQAQQALHEADVRRRQIATEVEALVNLRQQQWQDYRQEAARAQQEQLDELGMRRWLAAQAARAE
jgi:hypothetical protein